ncbi:unnamed protein product [Chrysoparadoxa australica]
MAKDRNTPPYSPRSDAHLMSEFSSAAANTKASDRCLSAACNALHFDIAELWTFVGGPDANTGKASVPLCLHVYRRPLSIEAYDAHALKDPNQMHILSPLLVEQARELEKTVWYTSADRDSPIHSELGMNTAVAIPMSLDAIHNDVVAVFLSLKDVHRREPRLEVLIAMSRAAAYAISKSFPAFMGVESMKVVPQVDQRNKKMAVVKESLLDISWNDLRDLQFLVNGSRCTIYTAFYGDKAVVVKLVRKDAPDKALVSRELDAEIGMLLRIQHPHIVTLVGAGSKPERFMLIERLDGGTLAQRCGNALQIRDRRRRFRHKRPFTYLELLKCAEELAEGLHYMHTQAIPGRMVIHRDLKPDNIAYSSNGTLKLIDLGLAKVMPRKQDDNEVFNMTGQTGSIRYMAPEVADCRPYNESCDVYSYGLILWEMAAMRKPFESYGRDIFFEKVVRGGERPSLHQKWPEPFKQLLMQCWANDHHSRPSFAEIVNSIQVE